MGQVLITEKYLEDIAEAIRGKNGSSSTYTPAQMATAITNIPSGGSSLILPGVVRSDAELVKSWSEDYLLVTDKSITIPAYTTSQTELIPYGGVSQSGSVNLTDYDAFFVVEALGYPIYNVSTHGAGRQEYYYCCLCQEMRTSLPNTIKARVNDTKVTARNSLATSYGQHNLLVYWSDTSTLTAASGTYGVNFTLMGPSSTTSSGGVYEVTPYTPTVRIRGNSRYLNSTYWGAMTDIRIQYLYKLYRIPRSSSTLNGLSYNTMVQHFIDRINSDNWTLG